MMVQKSFLAVLLILALSSCGAAVKPVEIISKPAEVVFTPPPAPNPIVLSNITWKVINLNDKIYYGISVSDYELLAVNMLEIKRYISAQKNIIVYYEQNTNKEQ